MALGVRHLTVGWLGTTPRHPAPSSSSAAIRAVARARPATGAERKRRGKPGSKPMPGPGQGSKRGGAEAQTPRDARAAKRRQLAKTAAKRAGALQADLDLPPGQPLSFLAAAREVAAAAKGDLASLFSGDGAEAFDGDSADEAGPESASGPRQRKGRGRGRGQKKSLLFDLLKVHKKVFHAALNAELAEEMEAALDRVNNWPREQLQDSGLALFDLEAQADGSLFRSSIARLAPSGRGPLPFHSLAHGDWVLLTAGGERHEGVVMSCSARWLRVALPEGEAGGMAPGPWRLDLYFSTTSHSRCVEALHSFRSPHAAGQPRREQGELALRRALLGHAQSAALPPPWAAPQDRLEGAMRTLRRSGALNDSQVAAVAAALGRTLTLWQGPPGTGKTRTLVQLVAAAAQLLGPGSQTLAACASNAAVDNLCLGLRAAGVRVVRVGQPVRVMPELQALTLDALVAAHPAAQSAAALRTQAAGLGRGPRAGSGAASQAASRQAAGLLQRAAQLEERAAQGILRGARVVAATCVGAADPQLAACAFRLCVLDEASQATEPASLIPLLQRCQAAVLVGDQCQLPPTVTSSLAEAHGLGLSLFERLQRMGLPPLLLDTQYRMHPAIAAFPAAAMYGGRLRSHPTPGERPAPPGFPWPRPGAPVAFVPCDAPEARAAVGEQQGTSYLNRAQAALVLRAALGLLAAGGLAAGAADVAVVTPYAGQVKEILQQVAGLPPRERALCEGLEVRTVDGFQGREKEVILMSTVRCNPRRSLGFLSDRRRLNVGLTRARRGLVVVGCAQTLRADRTWAAWLAWAEAQGLAVPAERLGPAAAQP